MLKKLIGLLSYLLVLIIIFSKTSANAAISEITDPKNDLEYDNVTTINGHNGKVGGYVFGDANGDGLVNVGDAVFLIYHIFKNGPLPNPGEAGDANGDCGANIGDVVYLINYVFRSGPTAIEGCCGSVAKALPGKPEIMANIEVKAVENTPDAVKTILSVVPTHTVTVTTDKGNYSKGEKVKVTVDVGIEKISVKAKIIHVNSKRVVWSSFGVTKKDGTTTWTSTEINDFWYKGEYKVKVKAYINWKWYTGETYIDVDTDKIYKSSPRRSKPKERKH